MLPVRLAMMTGSFFCPFADQLGIGRSDIAGTKNGNDHAGILTARQSMTQQGIAVASRACDDTHPYRASDGGSDRDARPRRPRQRVSHDHDR